MERTKLASKILKSVGYDITNQTLQIEFLKRPVYNYHDVKPEEVAAMLGHNMGPDHSVGSYFLRMIKPNHRCTKVEEKNEAQEKTETPPAATAPEK